MSRLGEDSVGSLCRLLGLSDDATTTMESFQYSLVVSDEVERALRVLRAFFDGLTEQQAPEYFRRAVLEAFRGLMEKEVRDVDK